MKVLQVFLLILVFSYLAFLSFGLTHFAAFLLTIAVPLAVVVGLLVRGRV